MRSPLAFGLILISFFYAAAQMAPPILETADPASVGMSAERLQMLDQFIEKYVDNKWLPGGVFLISRHGKIVYENSFGKRTIDSDKPYQMDDIFRIASMTKAITTVSIMQLYEKGSIGLDDPIIHYLPAFKDVEVLESFNEVDSSYTTVKAETLITIRHLLTHTSGITYGTFNPGKIQIIYEKFKMNAAGLSHDSWNTEELVNQLAKVPLVFQPGEKFLYGLNMDVLGRIIEVVSGLKLDEYFQVNIFEPIGMEDTYFYLPSDKHQRLVPVYSYDAEGGLIIGNGPKANATLDYPLTSGRNHFAGGGGLSSTARDYAKFIQVLCQGGSHHEVRLLGRKALEVMTSDQLILQNQDGMGHSKLPGITYGLGFRLYTEEGGGWDAKTPGTYEWGGYFNTKFFIDPKEQLTFVGMTQIVPFNRQEFWNRLYAIIYAAIEN